MDEPKLDPNLTERELLFRIARELAIVRGQLNKAIFSAHSAESEIPEKMRRFASYFHDIVHIKSEYVGLGLKAPTYIDREMERCDDRYRQLLDELHLDGGTFEKVRREMANDPLNRWDHTRQIAKPNGG